MGSLLWRLPTSLVAFASTALLWNIVGTCHGHNTPERQQYHENQQRQQRLLQSNKTDKPYSFEDLSQCEMTLADLREADRTTQIEPCIFYDTLPELLLPLQSNTTSATAFDNVTTIITVIGVFNSAADMHRDGGMVAIQKLNQDNYGRGAAIGYYRDHYVKFRFVVGIAGNRENIGPEAYETAHQEMLRVLLEDLKPQYILGTSSFDSDLEREWAGLYQTMLMAQVGPQSYYTNANRSNEYVFGAHIPSEDYGIPAFQALRFDTNAQSQRAQQKIRILYRDRSEFFYSTCRAVYDKAVAEGYYQTKAIEYNPDGDHDQDGLRNHKDIDFLQGLADDACSKEDAQDSSGIAVWGCFLTDLETNTILQRLRDNGCRLNMLWLTVASWEWPEKFPEMVPHVQSGGQWHQSMKFSDEYFGSGQEMIDYMTDEFGYVPSYGALGAYHAVYLMYKNVQSFFKGKDAPQVQATFDDPGAYEELRRSMMDLSLPHTLYGPTSFDEYRRNAGRGSAGMQWGLPARDEGMSLPRTGNAVSVNITHDGDDEDDVSTSETYALLLVSPIDQATAAVVFPAPASKDCPPGSFVNESNVIYNPDLLGNKCDLCPVNTFHETVNADTFCHVCVAGSYTDEQRGATICVELEDNMIPLGLLIFGYFVVAVVFACSIGFAIWTIRHREDPVVRIGQKEFLLLISLGPLISTSSIIAFTIQAGSLEDETAATRACTALPFLYATGWILQYGSLSAKSYRMYHTMKAAENMEGKTVTAADMYKIIILLLLLNWAIIIPWTILDPLEWKRFDQGTVVDHELGVMTYETYGRCSCEHFGFWAGPLLALHVSIMAFTNYLLYKIRHVSDRYQESKYVGMASVYACEFLLVGIPIMIAVGENAVEASFIIFLCIVGFGDLGILLMIFLPKIAYSRQGLPEGVTVGQSIFKSSTTTPTTSRKKAEQPAESSAVLSVQAENSNNNAVMIMSPLDSGVASSIAELSSEMDLSTSKTKQPDGALLNCLTLQW